MKIMNLKFNRKFVYKLSKSFMFNKSQKEKKNKTRTTANKKHY